MRAAGALHKKRPKYIPFHFFFPLHLSGEKVVGNKARVEKCWTDGVTALMHSFHSLTFLALSLALMDAAREGDLHNSITCTHERARERK